MGSCERDSSASEAHEASQTMRYQVPLEVSPVFFPIRVTFAAFADPDAPLTAG